MSTADASDRGGAADPLLGAQVVDAGANPVGAVRAVLVDPAGGSARWLVVDLTPGGTAVVPARVASADAHGRLVVPYPLDVLAGAPTPHGPTVTAIEARELLTYFGFPPEPAPSGGAR